MQWFERYPDRYANELQAFTDIEIDYEIDEQLKAKEGIIRLTLTIKAGNAFFRDFFSEDHQLVAVYPDSFPWFRPQVFDYGLALARHQNPLGKNLCLLPRATRNWNPEQTLASLLRTQIPLLLEKGVVEDAATVKDDPTEQAEPYAEYFHYQASILFDPLNMTAVPTDDPISIIGYILVGIPENASAFSRMAVKEIRDSERNKVYDMSSEIRKPFSADTKGVLIHLARRPPAMEKPGDMFKWLEKQPGMKEILSNLNSQRSFKDVTYKSVIGLRFPDETTKGDEGLSWLFLVIADIIPFDANNKAIDGKSKQPAAYFAKPAYISADAKKDRVPKLVSLVTKKVSVIGLGALGGYTAIELARAGIGDLRILDFDRVDPPTTVRWPLGLSSAGLLKTEVIANFIRENYPHTKVRFKNCKLGDPRTDGKHHDVSSKVYEWQIIDEITDGADIIIDATAEEGINNYLSYLSYLKDIPYVNMYATPGAWGGVVMRYLPGETGCWSCMKQWQSEDANLVPPVDSDGTIQPPGCGDITFTGAGFDLQQVSLNGVRLAISTLCRGEESAYPDCLWDWAVLRLVDEHGIPIPPSWTAQSLLPHPDCPYHDQLH
jgi:molybdopterin/thiamine biosynthesis adenylyltransferase